MIPHSPGIASRGIAGRRRLIGRWWRRQSPARQDRLATFGPLASVLLFLAAIISAFWYLRNEEMEREVESVTRDTEIAQQQIRLRLIENQEQLVRMAREFVTRELVVADFTPQARTFANDRPEITQFAWLGADRKPRARHSVQADREDGGGHDEEGCERHSGRSLRASSSAPKTAPSKSTERSSNGTR